MSPELASMRTEPCACAAQQSLTSVASSARTLRELGNPVRSFPALSADFPPLPPLPSPSRARELIQRSTETALIGVLRAFSESVSGPGG